MPSHTTLLSKIETIFTLLDMPYAQKLQQMELYSSPGYREDPCRVWQSLMVWEKAARDIAIREKMRTSLAAINAGCVFLSDRLTISENERAFCHDTYRHTIHVAPALTDDMDMRPIKEWLLINLSFMSSKCYEVVNHLHDTFGEQVTYQGTPYSI